MESRKKKPSKPINSTGRPQQKKTEWSAKERKAIISEFMSVTAKKIAAGDKYKPRPEDIPIPFTEEELRHIESVERGYKRARTTEKHEIDTEEERLHLAYMKLESKSFFFSS